MNKLFILIFFISYISADVMYEMEVKTQNLTGIGDFEALIRNFIKGDKMRSEFITKNSKPVSPSNFTITRLDKGVIWVFDNEKKEYSELSLDHNNLDMNDPANDSLFPVIEVKKLNTTKKILDINCEGYKVSVKTQIDNDSCKITQKMWMGRDFPGYDEIIFFTKKTLGNFSEQNLLGVNKKILKILQKKISEIEGFPMEIQFSIEIYSSELEMYWATNTTSIIKKISFVPITEKVFEIPEGYKFNNNAKNN